MNCGKIAVVMQSTTTLENCDQACKNRTYLHIKFGLFWNLMTYNFKIIKLLHWNIDSMLVDNINYLESRLTLQNMFIMNNNQEKFNFLNMSILSRYVWFSQAQSQLKSRRHQRNLVHYKISSTVIDAVIILKCENKTSSCSLPVWYSGGIKH